MPATTIFVLSAMMCPFLTAACTFRRAIGSGPDEGALREAIGLGGWFREEITAYDRPRAYSYRVVRSIPPFDHEGGTLTFTPSTDGTRVDWLTSYTHPAHAGGKLMEAISRRLLRWSFLAVLAGCAKALES
jgi:hypothetical protein